MTKIYLRSRFPTTKKAINKKSDENVQKLKDIMSNLSIKTPSDAKDYVKEKQVEYMGGSLFYENSGKKNKPRTFKL